MRGESGTSSGMVACNQLTYTHATYARTYANERVHMSLTEKVRAAFTYYDNFGLVEVILNLHHWVSLLGVLLREGGRGWEAGEGWGGGKGWGGGSVMWYLTMHKLHLKRAQAGSIQYTSVIQTTTIHMYIVMELHRS